MSKKQEERERRVSASRKGGRGTHGSIQKAGKVRSSTPKIIPSITKKNLSPKLKNRLKYTKIIVYKRDKGQAGR